MRKSIPVQNEGFIAPRSPMGAIRKMFETWLRAIRVDADSRKHDVIIQQLRGHLLHDIGESDYRPEPPTMDLLHRENAARLEAIRSRLM
jgi:hypothetical protein